MRALVLITGGVSVVCVRDLVLYYSAVVFIVGLCLFFMCLCWAIVEFSTLGTASTDIVGNY